MTYTDAARNLYSIESGKLEEELPLPVQQPHSSTFLFNRELSQLEFFRRVLEEGMDETQPLLERLKFLAIFSSNLDEFFMIRVSSLKEKLSVDDAVSPDGLSTGEELAAIRTQLLGMIEIQSRYLHETLLPRLYENGIVIDSYGFLPLAERQTADKYFEQKIYPMLTPQAVDPAHPFPYITAGTLNIGLKVLPKLNRQVEEALHNTGEHFFVRIEIPKFAPRFVPVNSEATKFILIEDLIIEKIRTLLPEAIPESCHLFRVTRDADVALRDDEAADLLHAMEQNLRQRRFGDVVRLEVSKGLPGEMLKYLGKSFEITEDDVYEIDGALDIGNFMSLCSLDRPDLKYEKLRVSSPQWLDKKGSSIFDIVRERDVLLHHPYEPYSVITDFIRDAARDEDVLAIKMCLYRTGANSPIPPLLIEAAENGKQVTVLVELKARFDEEANIEWAKRLERAGVHVVYGVPGLKTHCKTTLIVRREGEDLRRYVHIATGNYNPETSAFYTDLGLLTADEEIGADAAEVFNYLTAYSQGTTFRKLLVAPINLREKMIELIKREASNAERGIPARIIAKMNRLADTQVIHALYEASQAGVKIDLIVRGVCMLRPGVKGLSENITVRSIVGRLLEHSRIYYFANDGDESVFIGSSDWMSRNLNRRVEVLAPVKCNELKRQLVDEILGSYLRDNIKSRYLMSDGSYRKVAANPGQESHDSQMSFQSVSNVVKFEAIKH